jgi:hypothetical protein
MISRRAASFTVHRESHPTLCGLQSAQERRLRSPQMSSLCASEESFSVFGKEEGLPLSLLEKLLEVFMVVCGQREFKRFGPDSWPHSQEMFGLNLVRKSNDIALGCKQPGMPHDIS